MGFGQDYLSNIPATSDPASYLQQETAAAEQNIMSGANALPLQNYDYSAGETMAQLGVQQALNQFQEQSLYGQYWTALGGLNLQGQAENEALQQLWINTVNANKNYAFQQHLLDLAGSDWQTGYQLFQIQNQQNQRDLLSSGTTSGDLLTPGHAQQQSWLNQQQQLHNTQQWNEAQRINTQVAQEQLGHEEQLSGFNFQGEDINRAIAQINLQKQSLGISFNENLQQNLANQFQTAQGTGAGLSQQAQQQMNTLMQQGSKTLTGT